MDMICWDSKHTTLFWLLTFPWLLGYVIGLPVIFFMKLRGSQTMMKQVDDRKEKAIPFTND